MRPYIGRRAQATDWPMVGGRTKLFLSYLGANVRRLRLKRGMTQADLAIAARIDDRFLQKVERGVVNLRFQSLVKLADALDVLPAVLLRGAKPVERKVGRPRKLRRRVG
jgi:transcriptional regulator with XRE-family HTH domain